VGIGGDMKVEERMADIISRRAWGDIITNDGRTVDYMRMVPSSKDSPAIYTARVCKGGVCTMLQFAEDLTCMSLNDVKLISSKGWCADLGLTVSEGERIIKMGDEMQKNMRTRIIYIESKTEGVRPRMDIRWSKNRPEALKDYPEKFWDHESARFEERTF
jgi:hypothetical protein